MNTHDAVQLIRTALQEGRKILDPVRGMPAADIDRLADMLMRIGALALDIEEVAEIDLNPVILAGAKPVAVDALIVLRTI